MKKKNLLFILFIALFASRIFASSIAFVCFQNKDTDILSESVSHKFENFLIEPFFDKGYIVTDIPLAKVKSKNKIKISKLKRNFEQLTDYAVIVYIEYEKKAVYNSKLNRKIPIMKNVDVSLIKFDSGKEFYKKTINPKKLKEVDPAKKAQRISEIITAEVLTALSKSKGE